MKGTIAQDDTLVLYVCLKPACLVDYAPGEGKDDGSGPVEEIVPQNEPFSLPELPESFSAPEGKFFYGWKIGTDGPHLPGQTITPASGRMTITAYWASPWEDLQLETLRLLREGKAKTEKTLQYNGAPFAQLTVPVEKKPIGIKLMNHVRALDGDEPFSIPENASVILDLNGYELDRALENPTRQGYVLEVRQGSELTLKDSGESGETGKITGGNNGSLGHSGGVAVYGTLIQEGGSIAGNRARVASGVMLGNSSAKYRMKGGSVTGNTTSESGGVITVYGTFEISGNALVTGNAAKADGAVSVQNSGTLRVSGNARITGNTAADGASPCNVCLYPNGTVLLADETAGSDSRIGITLWSLQEQLGENLSFDIAEIDCDQKPAASGTVSSWIARFTSDAEGYGFAQRGYKHIAITKAENLVFGGDGSALTLPQNIREIGSYAFAGTAAESVAIPGSDEKHPVVGWGAFSADALRKIRIPSELETKPMAEIFGNRKDIIVFGPAGSAAEDIAAEYEDRGFLFVADPAQ